MNRDGKMANHIRIIVCQEFVLNKDCERKWKKGACVGNGSLTLFMLQGFVLLV